MNDIKKGSIVKYLGCSDDQVTYGGHSDPRGLFIVGNIYTVSDINMRAWSTDIYFDGVDGGFNSVCFELAEQDDTVYADCEKMQADLAKLVKSIKNMRLDVHSSILLQVLLDELGAMINAEQFYPTTIMTKPVEDSHESS